MLRSPHSPIHRSGRLLCGNFSGRTQTVNRSSEYLPDPQHFQPSSVGEHNSFPNPTSMMPVVAYNTNFLVSHPMDPVVSGMCLNQPPMHALHPHEFVDHHFVADSGLAANVHDPFVPVPQFFDVPSDFGGAFHSPPVVAHPPAPPPAPAASILANPGFQYHHCLWLGGPQCDGFAPGKNREMAEHLRVYHHFVGHERDVVSCQWQGCGQVMQRMNVARHIVSRHLQAAANCRFCGRRFCRPDVVARHERTCTVVPSI